MRQYRPRHLVFVLGTILQFAVLGMASDPIVMRQARPVSAVKNGGKNVVCFYTNWSQYRPEEGRFTPAKIDVSLCTHLIYAFAKIDGGLIAPVEWNDEDMYKQFNGLKAKKPGLKTLLSVGGWNLGSGPFSDVVATAGTRKRFIDHVITFLRDRSFDGLDIDWEWPTERGSGPEDRDRFTQFVKELRAAFDVESAQTSRDRLLLTIDVAPGKQLIDKAFDVPELAKYVDFLNVMTYNFHGAGWESCTGLNAPLYPRSTETGAQRYLNVDWAIKYWISKGAPASKLNLGVASYGQSYTLANPENHGICAPTTGPGTPGEYTRLPGMLSYYEICMRLKKGWTRVFDDEQKSNYAYKDDQWVGYDDVRAVKLKADYIKRMNLAGAMFWALDLDDFEEDFCAAGTYPLLRALDTSLQ